MGFYGNVKNTARTQFYFDRIYPNRKAMDSNAEKDNVFPGRFVLVEYEQDATQDSFQSFFMYKNALYTNLNFVEVTNVRNSNDKIQAIESAIDSALVRLAELPVGTVFCIPAGQHIQVGVSTDQYIRFTDSSGSYRASTKQEYDNFYSQFPDEVPPLTFKIGSGGSAAIYTNAPIKSGMIAKIAADHDYFYTGGLEFYETYNSGSGEDVKVGWRQISLNDDVFTRNFNIDKVYGTNRSYDSTVWQKVYEGNTERYIMIADLNTLAPAFTFTADAPAVTPVPIHYDALNTNASYNVHMQTPWGLRVRGASGELTVPLIHGSGAISDDVTNSVHATEHHGITYPSDFDTQWRGDFYDISSDTKATKYYSPVSGKWNGLQGNRSSSVDAAVYVNRDGFRPDTIVKSQDITNPKAPGHREGVNWSPYDYIGLEPTGYSGRVYNDHVNNEGTAPAIDTQELVIMLPSLGDAISNIWDIVYGGRDTNATIQESSKRNMDIQWEYANGVVARNGLRAIVDNNGRFQHQAVNTLAGCINSVHDLMGMIVVNNADSISADKLEDRYIYQFADGSYRRKGIEYTYTPATYKYTSIALDANSYAPGDYYIKQGNEYIQSNGAFSGDQTYYYKEVDLPKTYQPITLSPLPNFNLYYKTPEDNYRIVTEVAENVPYWKYSTSKKITVTAFYNKYTFYYGEADGFRLDTNESAEPGRGYWNIKTKAKANLPMRETWMYDQTKEQYQVGTNADGSPKYEDLKYFYAPGFFYDLVEDAATDTRTLKLMEETDISKIDFSKPYYLIWGNLKEGDGAGNWVQNPDGSFTNSNGVTNLQITGWYKMTLMPLTPNTYYYEAETTEYDPNEDSYDFEEDTPETEEGNEGESNTNTNVNAVKYITKYKYVTAEDLQTFYKEEFTFNENTAIFRDIYKITWENAGTFYEPGKFYYQTADLSWAKDHGAEMTEGRTYYESVTFDPVNGMIFYVPNKYYIVDPITGEFVIDKSPAFDKTKTYYEFLSKLYVMSDSRNRITPYSEWNVGVTQVPASVELATRVESITTVPLDNFARSLNTIHGLILQVNKMLEMDNFQTRDRLTVQGCINTLNDIIDKFDTLKPNNFLIVDNYGRVNDAHWDTLQKASSAKTKTSTAALVLSEGVTEDKFAEVSSVSAMRGQWLTVSLDSNPTNPQFRIHHNFQKVTDTTSTTNKNSDGVASSSANDKITLYTPIVDNMGHVVGKNTETVTLPYGFKTIASNGSSTSVNELTTSKANIVAENTQDTFTINMGNKWLRTATNASSDTMTFAHALSPIATQANTKYGLEADETVNLLDGDNTFEVPVFQFDEAGHITFAETHTVTIPEVFEKISVAGASTDTSDTTSSSGEITADSLSDTLNFASGNQWVQLSHNATTDTVTFKHYVKKFTEGTASTDLDNSATFTVQELAWDNAGHLTGSTKRTYTLQDGYKSVSVANSGANTTTSPTGSADTLTAANRVDTVSMDTGNRWITLVADATNKKMSIAHAVAGNASTSKGDTANQTPNFGSTFKVLSAGIDQTGHVSSLEEHTVKIPKPSLTDTVANGNVVVGLSLTDTTGAFTTSRTNVGTLALTGYTTPTTNGVTTIANTDSINGAFNKVQSYLNSLTSRIDGLDVTDTAVTGEFVSEVDQSNGKISVSRVAFAPSITITDGTSSDAPKVNVTVNSKSGTAQALTKASTSVYGVTKLYNGIDSPSTVLAATANAVKTAYDLASTAKGVADKAVVANGAITGGTKCKITYDAKGLVTGGADLSASDIPDLSATYVANAAKFEYDLTKVETYTTELAALTEAKLTIEQLTKKVATLEARIKALEPTA